MTRAAKSVGDGKTADTCRSMPDQRDAPYWHVNDTGTDVGRSIVGSRGTMTLTAANYEKVKCQRGFADHDGHG